MMITRILTKIAIEKYMTAGMYEVLSDPVTANITALIVVIKRPEIAVPTVYFETTSAER